MADSTGVDWWCIRVGWVEDHGLIWRVHFPWSSWPMWETWLHAWTMLVGPTHFVHLHPWGGPAWRVIKRILRHYVAGVGVNVIAASAITAVVAIVLARSWGCRRWSGVWSRQKFC